LYAFLNRFGKAARNLVINYHCAYTLKMNCDKSDERGVSELYLTKQFFVCFLSAALAAVSVPARGDIAVSQDSPSGPVLTLNYTGQPGNDIRIADFLYFVALISPEPVMISESPTNTLMVHVESMRQESRKDCFLINLAFDVSGHGFLHYAIDQSENFRRQARRLATGTKLEKQLDYIRYEGPGKGWLNVEGRIDGSGKTVTTVRLHFNDRGAASPVTIGLKDVRSVEGVLKFENELVARVNMLEFVRDGKPPRMGVRIDSVKRRDVGDNLFQNLKGQFVGMVANMLIKPITIRQIGNDTMLSFGRALLNRDATFTFPAAVNLKSKQDL